MTLRMCIKPSFSFTKFRFGRILDRPDARLLLIGQQLAQVHHVKPEECYDTLFGLMPMRKPFRVGRSSDEVVEQVCSASKSEKSLELQAPGPKSRHSVPFRAKGVRGPTMEGSGNRMQREETRAKRGAKTYNTRDSLVVTDPTTNLALFSLSMGERTGSRVL
ncbi:hypothetical protein VTI74DRAFT_3256 [Chaetomium olivicolor]